MNVKRLLRVILFIVTALSARTVSANIMFDTTSMATDSDGDATVSWTHTVGSGTDKILIVGTTMEDSTVQTVSTVKWNTTESLTLIDRQFINVCGAGCGDYVELWYLLNPTSTTANIDVTYAGAAFRVATGAMSLSGVKQQAPETSNKATAASGTASVSVTPVANGAWVVDAVLMAFSAGTLTVDPGQTQRLQITNAGSHIIGMSTKEVYPAASTSMSWSISALQSGIVAASFAPVSFTKIDDIHLEGVSLSGVSIQ